MAEASRILITGGGVAGLSLAIALRRRGYTPELAEQCPRWPAAGAGIALHANAVRALRALGLGEAVSRAAAPLPRYGFYDQHGDRLCTTSSVPVLPMRLALRSPRRKNNVADRNAAGTRHTQIRRFTSSPVSSGRLKVLHQETRGFNGWQGRELRRVRRECCAASPGAPAGWGMGG